EYLPFFSGVSATACFRKNCTDTAPLQTTNAVAQSYGIRRLIRIRLRSDDSECDVQVEFAFERTGHCIACIARECECQRIRFSVPRYGHRTAGHTGIARHRIVLHPDIPRTVGEGRMGITESSAAHLSGNGLHV